VVCYNYKKNKTTQIPEAIQQAIEKLEGRDF
jgi:acyl-CoA thioesterase FadM